MSTKIQAILFSTKSKYGWTLSKVKSWINNNNYKPIKEIKKHKEGKYFRVRLIQPKKNNSSYRTIYLSKDLGIKAIVQLQ